MYVADRGAILARFQVIDMHDEHAYSCKRVTPVI